MGSRRQGKQALPLESPVKRRDAFYFEPVACCGWASTNLSQKEPKSKSSRRSPPTCSKRPFLSLEPFSTSNNAGYTSGQGGQGYSSGGQGYNSGGYQQVAFHAQRASAYSRKGAPVAFERALTNLGGGWGRSGSIFTCPISGTYHFSWSALSSSNRELRLALVRSGEEVAASWADRDGYQTASGSATLN